MKSPINMTVPNITELTQNAARWMQQELAASAQAGSPVGMSTSDLELARSNIQALAFAQGLSLHGAYRFLRDFIARQAVPIWSSGKILDGWLESYKMKRKRASAATGSASGTGVNGALLQARTVLQSDQGHRYVVQTDATVAAGVIHVSLQAELPGATSNVSAGTVLKLVSSEPDIDSTFTVDSGGLANGTNDEKDEQALYRLQQRIANPPMGGCPGDYARWALEVPGITRAWGLRNPVGPTSAGVIIMADDNADMHGLPTLSQQQAVYDYIRDPKRGPPDELFVIVPTLTLISPHIILTPDTSDTREGALAALSDLFLREAVPGGDIPHSHLFDVVSDVVGEYNHAFVHPTMTSGGVFSAPGFDHLLALGDVTFGGV